MSSILQDPGSFRDPLSKVFVGDGKVVRAFTEMGAADIDKVWKKKSIQRALESGDLIESTIVEPASSCQRLNRHNAFERQHEAQRASDGLCAGVADLQATIYALCQLRFR